MSYKIKISIDDVCPHENCGFKWLDNCEKLFNTFPNVKFTLFVPLAYWRVNKFNTGSPLFIQRFPEFVKKLKELPEDNFRLGLHGFYHSIPESGNDNDEFAYLPHGQAINKFKQLKSIIDKVGLKFDPIFRPPAWKMSPESIKVAKTVGIKKLCLSHEQRFLDTHKGEHIKQFEDNIDYANFYPPFFPLNDEVENMSIVYHACDWDKNYLSVQLADELTEFLKKLNDIQFEFLYG